MSCVSLDYTNCLAPATGATHGLNQSEIEGLVAKFGRHHKVMLEYRDSGETGFFDLPSQNTDAISSLIEAHTGAWQDLVMVGVGGGAIGPAALLQGLGHSHWNDLPEKKRKGAPRVFFLDNPDSRSIKGLLDVIDIKKTCFVINSSSGTSPEANALFAWVVDTLRRKAGKTSPSKQVILACHGDAKALLSIAEAAKITQLPLASNIDNRFGMFTPAALFMAGLCRCDYQRFLAGAQGMAEYCNTSDAGRNPAYMHALIHYILSRKRRKTINVVVALEDRLSGVVQWYEHLTALCLGKMHNRKGKAVHVGPTPCTCLGANGINGVMQLCLEGPYDKAVTFLVTKERDDTYGIPTVGDTAPWSCLGGQPMADILHHSHSAAAERLSSAGRPNLSFIIPDTSAASIGALVYVLGLSTIMSAELYAVDAFDQPGVVASRLGIAALLGCPGLAEKRLALQAYAKRPIQSCGH